jgi:hypothetical protein
MKEVEPLAPQAVKTLQENGYSVSIALKMRKAKKRRKLVKAAYQALNKIKDRDHANSGEIKVELGVPCTATRELPDSIHRRTGCRGGAGRQYFTLFPSSAC